MIGQGGIIMFTESNPGNIALYLSYITVNAAGDKSSAKSDQSLSYTGQFVGEMETVRCKY